MINNPSKNSVKNLIKNSSFCSSFCQKQKLRNLSSNPTKTQVSVQVSVFFRNLKKYQEKIGSEVISYKPSSKFLFLIRNLNLFFQVFEVRNLLLVRVDKVISGLWFLYPPYTMGVKIPP